MLQEWLASLPLERIPYNAVLDLVNNKMRVSQGRGPQTRQVVSSKLTCTWPDIVQTPSGPFPSTVPVPMTTCVHSRVCLGLSACTESPV